MIGGGAKVCVYVCVCVCVCVWEAGRHRRSVVAGEYVNTKMAVWMCDLEASCGSL